MLKFSSSPVRSVQHYFDVLSNMLYTLLISPVYNSTLLPNLLYIACCNILDTSPLFSLQSLTLVLTSPKAPFLW